MKFKSLETVIREMHANRNTELRKKVPNVSRPDTAKDPTDEKSRHYMQAQIKTKIIDEEQIDEISSETRDRYISGAVKDTLGHLKSEKEKGKTPETKRKIHNRVKGMERAAIANRKAVDKKYNKEEVELDEVSKEKLLSYTSAANKQIMSNYDKDGRKMPLSKEIDREKHVYKAQKKIIHKIMKEASDLIDDEEKKKKSDSTKTVGGKTEIELNPKTDDKIDNQSQENKDSKKTRNKVNKEIGVKSAPMKEEKMLNKDKFGITSSLVDSVKKIMEAKFEEELKGNQHKIDANHNGKIDSQDFKILKGKKKMSEEDKSCGCKGKCQCSTNEEVEQVDEISKELAGRYVAKAAGDMHKKNAEHSKHQDAKIKAGTAMRKVKAMGPDHGYETDSDHAARVDRLAKRRGEAEKAAHSAAKKASNRLSGIHRAGKTLAKEEVEFSANELARIEEIAKGL